MSNGGYFPYYASTGRLDLLAEVKKSASNLGLGVLTVKKAEIDLDVIAGEIYFIELQITYPAKFVAVDAELGLQQIRNCNLTNAI